MFNYDSNRILRQVKRNIEHMIDKLIERFIGVADKNHFESKYKMPMTPVKWKSQITKIDKFIIDNAIRKVFEWGLVKNVLGLWNKYIWLDNNNVPYFEKPLQNHEH